LQDADGRTRHARRSTKVGLDTLTDQHKFKNMIRKTKIVCTMGPACWSEVELKKLLEGGMNVMRLNFSHGSHEGHLEVLQRFRKVGFQPVGDMARISYS
jgi:hypothetical protein